MYNIIFDDNTMFEGSNPQESKWQDIPNKPIKSIEYNLTPFLKYIFSNFESYNHIVERVNGINSNLKIISKVIIMGRSKNRIYQVMFDDKGNVYRLVVKNGEEYSPTVKIIDNKFAGWLDGKPTLGWKIGIPNAEPRLEKYTLKQGTWVKE